MQCVAGVDVGGTTCTIALGSLDRRVEYVSKQFPTEAFHGPKHTVQNILMQLKISLQTLGISPKDCLSVGLSTPGPATLDGILLKTPNLKHEHWDRFPIRDQLAESLHSDHFNCNVHYIGDGQAAVLGELVIRTGSWSWGQATSGPKDVDLCSLFMLTVGTGLGGGEIRDRKVVRGLGGRAGHGGHIFLPRFAFRYEHDSQLLVGNATSTAESAISLTALTHQLQFRLQLPQWRHHGLNKLEDSTYEKAKQLRNLLDIGDELALELFDDQAHALGIALLSVNYVGDYDLMVIGGGICDISPAMRKRYLDNVQKAYRKYALDGFRDTDRVEFSVCGDEAPVIGATAHAAAQMR